MGYDASSKRYTSIPEQWQTALLEHEATDAGDFGERRELTDETGDATLPATPPNTQVPLSLDATEGSKAEK